MSIIGRLRAILRLERRRKRGRLFKEGGFHRFFEGGRVEFTQEAISQQHYGIRGQWTVTHTEPTRPVGPENFVLHPQMVYLEGCPVGRQISGRWLQPVSKK